MRVDGQPLYFLPYTELQPLIQALISEGYVCVGPQVKDGAIVYDELNDVTRLPWGIREHQSLGEYRLETISEHKAFAFSNGPQALKPFLFKPLETVWRVERDLNGRLTFQSHHPKEPPIAFMGARACDLAAMNIQDQVFLNDPNIDIRYKQRREHLFLIAINCTYASDHCFCVSAGTGPHIRDSYDIVMTEIDAGFVVNAGSTRGSEILRTLSLEPATHQQMGSAKRQVDAAAEMQTKRMPLDNTSALRDLLFSNLDHPRWDEVADRCLSCGNCTSVCPTCFCHSEIEKPSLDGSSSERQREWDSCFTSGHSQLNGQVIRDDTKKRYRQWVTHKLGSWFDQFGSSGCVGCGRCLTWCPVGIDLTEEVALITGDSNQMAGHKT